MAVRNQADADYVKRLNILRSAGGSLPLTDGTSALFAEREARTLSLAAIEMAATHERERLKKGSSKATAAHVRAAARQGKDHGKAR